MQVYSGYDTSRQSKESVISASGDALRQGNILRCQRYIRPLLWTVYQLMQTIVAQMKGSPDCESRVHYSSADNSGDAA